MRAKSPTLLASAGVPIEEGSPASLGEAGALLAESRECSESCRFTNQAIEVAALESLGRPGSSASCRLPEIPLTPRHVRASPAPYALILEPPGPIRVSVSRGELLMTTSHDGRNVEFGGPANYRIVVQGLLSDNCRRRFAGMRIEVSRVDGEAPRTVLVGPVRDQAELRGVLDALYGLHMPVIAVERCEAG